MSDLIDRQVAIDKLQKEINKGTPPFDDVMGAIRCGVRLARNIIEDLPSADPHWIPCSERFSEEFGEYLVTKKAIGWNCEEYNSNDIAYFDNEGFHKADKVLAWMPLPEAYGGEGE